MKPRFLLDEHIAHAIQQQLRRRGPAIEILIIGDDNAPARGTLDPDILLWIEQNGYILVTRDRNSMQMHLVDHYATGGHIPGILWLRSSARYGEIIETLLMIWSASTADEYVDCMFSIPF